MKVLIVHAHPEPTSFNAALTHTATAALRDAGHEVVVSDLYAEGFQACAGREDFVGAADQQRFHYQGEQARAAATQSFAPDLSREHERLLAADLLVLQFPLWWGGPPAILKGWIDRVHAYGIAYVDRRRFKTGVFNGRRSIRSVTTGGTPERFRPEDAYGHVDQVLWPIRRLVLEYMDYEVEEPFVSYGVPRVDAARREAYLAAWRDRILTSAVRPVAGLKLDPFALIASIDASAWTRPS